MARECVRLSFWSPYFGSSDAFPIERRTKLAAGVGGCLTLQAGLRVHRLTRLRGAMGPSEFPCPAREYSRTFAPVANASLAGKSFQ